MKFGSWVSTERVLCPVRKFQRLSGDRTCSRTQRRVCRAVQLEPESVPWMHPCSKMCDSSASNRNDNCNFERQASDHKDVNRVQPSQRQPEQVCGLGV